MDTCQSKITAVFDSKCTEPVLCVSGNVYVPSFHLFVTEWGKCPYGFTQVPMADRGQSWKIIPKGENKVMSREHKLCVKMCFYVLM